MVRIEVLPRYFITVAATSHRMVLPSILVSSHLEYCCFCFNSNFIFLFISSLFFVGIKPSMGLPIRASTLSAPASDAAILLAKTIFPNRWTITAFGKNSRISV